MNFRYFWHPQANTRSMQQHLGVLSDIAGDDKHWKQCFTC